MSYARRVLELRTATRADRADVVRVMAMAFDDDPVTRWMVPAGRSLEPLFRAHTRWANPAHVSIDLAVADGRPVGAAVWHAPGYRVPLWRQVASMPHYGWVLGRRVGRGAAVESLMHRARPRGEFWYLAGVGAVRRGEGIGSALLRHRLDRVSGPAYLESSKKENLPLYQRFGFELRDPIHVPDGPELWPMWRPA